MKRYFKRSIAMILAITLIFTSVIVPASANVDVNVVDTNNQPANAGIGNTVYFLGRTYTDWLSLEFDDDTLSIGNVFDVVILPEKRVELKDSALIEKFIKHATDIKNSASNLNTQYTDGNHEVIAIAGKYQPSWDAYITMLKSTKSLVLLQEEKAVTTDPFRLAELEIQISAANNILELHMQSFINSMNACVEDSLEVVLANVMTSIWNYTDPETTYLDSFEKHLRQACLFEHQITDDLAKAMQSCADSMLQIFILYEEYYSYMEIEDPDNFSHSPYYQEFFKEVCDDMILELNKLVVSTGYASYMVEKALSNEEVKKIQKYDPNFVAPEGIHFSTKLYGRDIPCYRVKANDDLNYYLILKSFIGNAELVFPIRTNYLFEDVEAQAFRPNFLLECQFTDDGKYQLISDNDRPDFMNKVNTGLLSALRNDCKLTDIPKDTTHFLLYSIDCEIRGDDATWNMEMLRANSKGTDPAVIVNTKDDFIYGDIGEKSIAIYRDITIDKNCVDGVWKVTNYNDINNKAVTVGEGQTLDLGSVGRIENVTINIIGKAKVKGTYAYYSDIRILTNKPVILDNMYIYSKSFDFAAIKVLSNDANIRFENNCSASGYCDLSGDIASKLYSYYSYGKPLGVSNGLYISDKANIVISGESKFSGSFGGAGICVTNGVNISGDGKAKMYAFGSRSVKYDKEAECYPENIGAGIGGCFSINVKNTKVSDGGLLGEPEYKEIPYLGCKDYIGENASIKISNVTCIAAGAYNSHYMSEDIGSVTGPGILYNISEDSYIKNSEVDLFECKINKNIQTQNNGNYFNDDVYTINTYTYGSNGVSDEGISFKIHGDRGSTPWISTDCGKTSGDWTGTFEEKTNYIHSGNIPFVGNITKVEVKTNSSNHWFPGKITVSTKYGGEEFTVFGGRWIGSTPTMLMPTDKIYKVTVQTGTDNNAGTDSEVYLNLKSKNGTKTNTYQLDDIHPDSNAFENGDKTSFVIYAPSEFDECTNILLRSNHSGAAAGWQVDSIAVENIQGGTDKGFKTSTGYWYEYDKTVNFGKYSGNTGVFNIEVKTADRLMAGTDSDLYLTLYGENGKTEQINMGVLAGSGNNFERGDKDTFKIGFEAADLGKITGIDLHMTGNGIADDWYLEYIKITEEVMDDGAAQSVTFKYNNWIEGGDVRMGTVYSTTIHKSPQRIDREVISKIQLIDGIYTLPVDKTITISSEIFKHIADEDLKLKIVMNDMDKPLYEVTFDGNLFEDCQDIALKQDYSLSDGKAKFDFLSNSPLPTGTKVKIYPKNSNFADADTVYVFGKTEAGIWEKVMKINSEDGGFEFDVEDIRNKAYVEMIFSLSEDVNSLYQNEEVPNTGDNTNLYLWMMLIALVSMVSVANTYSRKTKN